MRGVFTQVTVSRGRHKSCHAVAGGFRLQRRLGNVGIDSN